MFKHKNLKGNVCLVVLLAFILTFIPVTPGGVGGSSVVQAATKTHDLAFDFSGPSMNIAIDPVSPTSFRGYSLELKFRDSNGDVVATFNVASLPTLGAAWEPIVTDVTYGTVYAQVYNGNLLLEYVPANGVNVGPTDDWVYAEIYGNVYQSIYLDVALRPPSSGGSGSSTPPSTTVTTDTGVIAVSGDTATVSLDTAKTSAALEQTAGDTLEIRLPDQVRAGRYEVDVPSDLLTKMEEKGKGLAFIAGGAVITLPPGTIDLNEVRKLAADARVKMVVEKVAAGQTGELLRAAAADQRSVGDVFEFDLKAVAGTGSQAREQSLSLSKPVRVAAAFDAARVASGVRSFLGLYRYEGSAWGYRKSWVQPGTDQVAGQLHSFSKYTVMMYRKTFADTAFHWSRSDVELMASKHIVKGVSDTAFNPDGKVTRAEFAAMVVRALGLPVAAEASTFTDVATDAWYAGSVRTAAKAGVVLGMGDGTFRPNDRITREQMAVMVTRALKAVGKSVTADQVETILQAFADRGRISGWARDGVALAAQAGVVQGRDGGVFAPADDATRAEAAAMIKRYLGSVGEL